MTPYPNWKLITRGEPNTPGYIDDETFTERWRYLTGGDPSIRQQMVMSTKLRKLVPPPDWEELVDFAVLKAVVSWKGNGDGRCPLKNYAWIILLRAGQGYWARHKNGILNSVQLDAPKFMDP